MRPGDGTAGGFIPALLFAAVASIVLGLIGMHALNTHGVTMGNADHATMTGQTAMDMAGGQSGNLHHGQGVAVGSDAFLGATAGTAITSDGDAGHGMGTMQVLCVAMLAAAGALLAIVVALRRVPRLWAHLRAALTPVALVPTARLGTGPPPVWEFSVIRC